MIVKRNFPTKALCAVLASAIVLPGCAYLAPLHAPNTAVAVSPSLRVKSESTPEKPCKAVGCVDEAIEYGEVWQKHYYQLASQDVALGRLIPSPIIPLSTIAAYRATGAKPDVHLARGYAMTAGALFVASQYTNLSKDAGIFLAGAEGLSCALEKARPLARPSDELVKAKAQYRKFEADLTKAQAKYTELRLSEAVRSRTDGNKDGYAAVQDQIYSRIDRRLAYYERVHTTAGRALEEVASAGDRTRSLIEQIVLQTATELAKATPDLDKLKTGIADLPALAQALGSIPEEEPATSPPAGGAGQNAPTPTPAPAPAAASAPAPAGVSAASGAGGAPAASPAPPNPPATSGSEKHAASDTAKQGTAAEKTAVRKPARPQEVKDALSRLVAMLEANTGELSFSIGADGVLVQGMLTRPKSEAELKAVKAEAVAEAKAKLDAATRQAERAKEITGFIHKIRESKEFVDLRSALASAAESAHATRYLLKSWADPKTVTAGCDDGEANSADTSFAVTPRLDSKVLTVGEPFKLLVRNARLLPIVRLAGENTANFGTSIEIDGEAFAIVVLAKSEVPAASPASLVIVGHNGRQVKINLSAKKK